MGSKGISRFGTEKTTHVSISKYLAQVFHPAGQTEVLPWWHPCVHSLCVGLWEKCCQGRKSLLMEKNFSGRFHLNTPSDPEAGTMRVAPCWLEESHSYSGIPTKVSLSTIPPIPSPCQHPPAPVQLWAVLHTSSPVLKAFLPGYPTTWKRTSPIRERYAFYRRQLDFTKE